MADIIDRLKEPEAHYPGNFDTPKRANAMLSCMCQEAIEEIESLRRQLAEKSADIERLYKVIDANWVSQKQIIVSQLLVEQLREALEKLSLYVAHNGDDWVHLRAKEALALPQDTTALEAMIAKAGEAMRERCVAAYKQETATWKAWPQAGAAERKGTGVIRALPAITIDDLKGGAA